MKSNSEIVKLAKMRQALRTSAHSVTTYPVNESSDTQIELLRKICANLPEREQARCRKFEEMFSKKTNSQYSNSRTISLRASLNAQQFTAVPRRRSSDMIFDIIRLNIPHDSMFEVKLKDSSNAKELLSSIWIGDKNMANDSSLLIKHRIQGIVTIGQENEPNKFPHVLNGYFMIPIFQENFVWEATKAAFKTLELMLHKGNVLVHCENGCLYAPIIVIGYLIKKFGMVYSKAKERVMKGHPKIFITGYYEKELKKLERLIIGGYRQR